MYYLIIIHNFVLAVLKQDSEHIMFIHCVTSHFHSIMFSSLENNLLEKQLQKIKIGDVLFINTQIKGQTQNELAKTKISDFVDCRPI